MGRSREGAWIEMDSLRSISLAMQDVAPARERGLKYLMLTYIGYKPKSRSREGAWIEI